jgi:23S rRNA (cytidine1920-2'-O)/16S rRNA (cytidine1409-2'-O)-methyltransferase
MNRQRLDQLVVDRGLAESREKAQRLIRAGSVRVDGQTQTKPGHLFAVEAAVELEQPERFVGRGGEKLEAALRHFAIDVNGRIGLDVGASTGGFTDCLLQHGARHVYAVDVGRQQLHSRLRVDPRVTVMDGVNARYLTHEPFPEAPDFAVIDVSFISLTLILPAVVPVLAAGAGLVTLIKPQFEAGRHQVNKGGVVRDERVREEIVERIQRFGVDQLGLAWLGVVPSPLKGPAGNVEFLAAWRKAPRAQSAAGTSGSGDSSKISPVSKS